MIEAIEIFFGMIGFLTVLAFVFYVLFKCCQYLFEKDDEIQQEDPDEFFDRIYREQEESSRKFEELIIKIESKKHRFDKLKSPKPKWIQQ